MKGTRNVEAGTPTTAPNVACWFEAAADDALHDTGTLQISLGTISSASRLLQRLQAVICNGCLCIFHLEQYDICRVTYAVTSPR